MHFWDSQEHHLLNRDAPAFASGAKHLRDLLQDEARTKALIKSAEGIHVDASRSLLDLEQFDRLVKLYHELGVGKQVEAMFHGKKINETENRAVGHAALRNEQAFVVDSKDYKSDVHHVNTRIFDFADKVRSGSFKGFSGKNLTDVVCIGIGGSYLGVEFCHEAFRTHKPCCEASSGRRLRFLANVDPIDVKRALQGLDVETLLVIVLSKTFTTAETMLNARTVREKILEHYGNNLESVKHHLCAVSTNLSATAQFGIADENVFGFWDWVGGRFSVTSAVGVLPLALQYGKAMVQEFLGGCRAMDTHVLKYASAPQNSLAAFMAMISFYNASYLNFSNVAVLPYCQALCRFPAHIQQLCMESNGKRVCMDGITLPSERFSGEIYFGEPGTNGQHSFYQLIHQGRVIPCEFIGFTKSQNPIHIKESSVSSHDELMSNFFAQPDALALGKSADELLADKCPQNLIAHKTFPGNRPSTCLLFEGELTPAAVGRLLALYEHRVAVEGFLWGINSFDQWGVELGKVLAKKVRGIMEKSRSAPFERDAALPRSTNMMLETYFKH